MPSGPCHRGTAIFHTVAPDQDTVFPRSGRVRAAQRVKNRQGRTGHLAAPVLGTRDPERRRSELAPAILLAGPGAARACGPTTGLAVFLGAPGCAARSGRSSKCCAHRRSVRGMTSRMGACTHPTSCLKAPLPPPGVTHSHRAGARRKTVLPDRQNRKLPASSMSASVAFSKISVPPAWVTSTSAPT